jgi:hypothetical protein
MTSEQTIRDALSKVKIETWRKDYLGGAIGCENEKSGGFAKLFDIRGWGYFTGTGHGGLALSAADGKTRRDSVGDYLVAVSPAAIAAMLIDLESLRAENERMSERLQVDPGGGDAIDALESALGALRDVLKPFALISAAYDGTLVEDTDPVLVNDKGKLVAGDLRRAAFEAGLSTNAEPEQPRTVVSTTDVDQDGNHIEVMVSEDEWVGYEALSTSQDRTDYRVLFEECAQARDEVGFLGSVPDCIRSLDAELKSLSPAQAIPDGFTPSHRHKKRGSTYQVIATGRLQVDGDLDMEKVTVYRGEDGDVWIRPDYEFNDGRFEALAASEGGE